MLIHNWRCRKTLLLNFWLVKYLLISNNFIAALTLSLTSVDNDVRCRHSFFLPPYCEDNFLDPPLSNIQPNYWKKTKYNSLFLQVKIVKCAKALFKSKLENTQETELISCTPKILNEVNNIHNVFIWIYKDHQFDQ